MFGVELLCNALRSNGVAKKENTMQMVSGPRSPKMRRTRSLLLTGVLIAGFAAVNTHVTAAPAEAIGIHYSYYDNYFKSSETCKARGKKLMKEVSIYVSFSCYKKKGNAKWSMDIYYDDGLGCYLVKEGDRSRGISGDVVSRVKHS